MITVSGKELYWWRRNAIAEAQIAQVSVKEVDWLLQAVTTLDSLALRLESFQNDSAIAVTHSLPELTRLWQQRLKNYLPLQYLVGQTSWRNWQFTVSPAVLIPRPETELIIEIVQQAEIPQVVSNHWVDLGTGSGAIAISLAALFPQAVIHAVDLSDSALKIAQQNAATAQQKVNFYQGSWWTPLQHLKGQFTGMISNPPYIPSSELPQLQPEVFRHEPHLALDGGEDGLAAIRHLVTASPQYLVSGGIWLIEMMAGQGKQIVTLLVNQGEYYNIKVIPDLAGIDRFVLAYRR